MKYSVRNKTILVTGGTSQLGRDIVKKAIAGGATVFFTYFQNKIVAEELQAMGAKAYQVDLLRINDLDLMSKEIFLETKSLDVLIHNAAVVRDKTIQNMSEEEWDAVLNADLKAPYYLTQKLLPLIFKSQQGKIFFITSRVGILGGYGVSNYAAAKAGLIGLTKSLAQELGKKRILVNAINPGFMCSKMTKELPDKVIEKNLKASPLESWSEPAEVADFLLYLSSDAVKQITGKVIHAEARNL